MGVIYFSLDRLCDELSTAHQRRNGRIGDRPLTDEEVEQLLSHSLIMAGRMASGIPPHLRRLYPQVDWYELVALSKDLLRFYWLDHSSRMARVLAQGPELQRHIRRMMEDIQEVPPLEEEEREKEHA